MYFDINNDRHKIYFAKEMTCGDVDKDIIVESINDNDIYVTDIDLDNHTSYCYSNKCISIEMDIYNKVFDIINSNKLNNKRVAFILDFKVGYDNTNFYKSIFKMLNDFGYSIDVISDNNSIHFIKDFCDLDVDLFFDIDNIIDNNSRIINDVDYFFDTPKANNICFSLKKYLEDNTPSLIISDNYYGLKSIESIDCGDIKKLIYIPKRYKWNINDILDSSYENSSINDFLNLIKNSNNDIDISVCSENIKDIISKYTDEKNIFVLDSPNVDIKDIVNNCENNKQGILCIGDHSEESNHSDLIRIISPTGIPITFICNNPKEKINENSLEDLILKNSISSYNIIDGNVMEYLEIIVKMHRAVIDLSNNTNEYFIQKARDLGSKCIINQKSNTNLDGVEKINTDEMIQSIKTLIKAYGNPYNVVDLDFNNDSINEKTISDWRSYIER